MTLLSATGTPNSFAATPATTRLLSSSDPSLAIVAEVPMHRSFSGWQALADPAHQQRHVRALAAAVRAQLVQDQEAKARAVADDPAVELVLPRHQEFQHHEVGQENVRGLVRNPLPLVPVLLARVARERDPAFSGHLVDELAQFLHLRVRQRVHRVHDDGVRAPLGRLAAWPARG